MSSSGYKDKAKLVAALELARSFMSAKPKAGKGPQASRGKPQVPSSQFTSNARPPLPSQRNCGMPGNSKMPLQSFSPTPLIGSADLDFLSRRDQAPAVKDNSPKAPSQSPDAPVADAFEQAPKDYVFKREKPEGVAPGSMLDDFFTLVDEANDYIKKPAENKESLIDFEEGKVLVLGPSEQGSSTATDWLVSEVNEQSSTLMSALSATPPAAETKAPEEKIATSPCAQENIATSSCTQEKTRLSAQASSFTPAKAPTPGHDAHISSVVPLVLPAGLLPSTGYVVIVPLPGAVPLAGHQAFQAQPGITPFAVPQSVTSNAQGTLVEASRARKPKGGLSTSKWAS